MDKEMVSESKSGQTRKNMKGSGKMERLPVTDAWPIRREMSTKVSGKTIWQMGREYTYNQEEANLKGSL